MKKILFTSIAITSIYASSSVLAENLASDLVGEWHYTEANCTDHFTFTDNHFSSNSNKETIEGNIVIHPLADNSITQLQVDREVTFDSLGPDCAGTDKNDTGRKDTRYIKFNSDKTNYMVCIDQQGKKCWGPIEKG
ncbi:hypothetical protein LIN78_07435 [Leeia sp. TBRC 13508]|uniref:Uncharacterized protein n=1 Tax=Leeia speluncae TaxID=2884804 RepID=A0ABS8D579_9NEIS|nr:hypothetical protein [Leeia speluncae]MCB6183376.1 hypothetical protein [Leeia speluncae]